MKPTVSVVELQHKCQILAGSGLVGATDSNLDSEDNFVIDDEEVGRPFCKFILNAPLPRFGQWSIF